MAILNIETDYKAKTTDEVLEWYNEYSADCKKGYGNMEGIPDKIVAEATKEMGIDDARVAVKAWKTKYCELKDRHTARVMHEVMEGFKLMNASESIIDVAGISGLLHDVAFPMQLKVFHDYRDVCLKAKFNAHFGHADYGHNLLINGGYFREIGIPLKLQPMLGTVVLEHQKNASNLSPKYLRRIPENETNILKNALDDILVNENWYELITGAILQMVRDIDKLDILTQRSVGEYANTRVQFGYDIRGDSLDDVADKWDIDPQTLLEWNKWDKGQYEIERAKEDGVIQIPANEVPAINFVPDKDMQEMLEHQAFPDLKEMFKRRSWNFIDGLWWTLGTFFKDFNFRAVLEIIEKEDLLHKIFMAYPERYRVGINYAIEYAQDNFVESQLQKTKGQLYLHK